MAFEAGNLVRLKSSMVPVMTVASVDGDNVRCIWMEVDGKRHNKREDTFPAVVLTSYIAPPPIQARLGLTSTPRRGY